MIVVPGFIFFIIVLIRIVIILLILNAVACTPTASSKCKCRRWVCKMELSPIKIVKDRSTEESVGLDLYSKLRVSELFLPMRRTGV